MGIEQTVDLTTISGPDRDMLWAPPNFKARQLRDYLDFRASFGSGDVSILRLMSNADVHLYGELVLQDGPIRSYNTIALGCLDKDQDIVSFRTSKNEGTEVARIKKDGTVESWAGFRGVGPATTVSSQDRDDGYTAMTVEASSICLKAWDVSTSQLLTWGTAKCLAGNRILEVKDTDYETLTIEASDIALKALSGSTLETWGTSKILAGNRILEIKDGSTYHTLEIEASDITLKALDSSTLRTWGTYKFSSGDRVLEVKDTAYQSLTIEASDITLKALDSSTLRQWGAVSFLGGQRILKIWDGTDFHELTTSAEKHIFRACDGATTSVSQWGSLEFSSGDRLIKAHDGTDYKELTTSADKHIFRACNGSSTSVDRWGSLEFASGDRLIKAHDGTDYKELTTSADKHIFKACDGSTTSVSQWGSLEFVSNVRVLKVHDGGSSFTDLTIKPSVCKIESQAASGAIFEVENISSSSRLAVQHSGDVIELHGNELTITENVDLAALGGGNMATVGDQNTTAGTLLVHYFDIPMRLQWGEDDYDIAIDDKIKVIDVEVIKTENAGSNDWVQVRDENDNNISDQIDISGADKLIYRATWIDDAYSTLTPGGLTRLRVTAYQDPGGNRACDVFVHCIRVS